MRLRIIGAASAAAILTACGSQGLASRPALPFPAGTVAARPASVIGVTLPGVPQSYAPAAAFSLAIGRPVSLVMYYSGWGESFRSSFAQAAWNHGAVTLVNTAPGSLSQIAAGDSDGYLRRFAAQVRTFGHPVVLAFGHEANGDWYGFGHKHQSAAEYIAAYRHVHDVITAAGGRDVTWLWTVNIPVKSQTAPPAAYYPGDRYVTWAGIDGYDWTGKETFTQEFGATITAIRKLTRAPVLISETSVIQGPEAAAQVAGLFSGIRAHALLGLVWFDADKSGYKHTRDTHDWRLEDDPAALAAFRKAVAQGGR